MYLKCNIIFIKYIFFIYHMYIINYYNPTQDDCNEKIIFTNITCCYCIYRFIR